MSLPYTWFYDLRMEPTPIDLHRRVVQPGLSRILNMSNLILSLDLNNIGIKNRIKKKKLGKYTKFRVVCQSVTIVSPKSKSKNPLKIIENFPPNSSRQSWYLRLILSRIGFYASHWTSWGWWRRSCVWSALLERNCWSCVDMTYEIVS